ncbi:hypothetical protein Bca101_043523 [Brassica carinata]
MKELDVRSPISALPKQNKVFEEPIPKLSGFGWDDETKRFTASEEVWQGYIKGHPNHQRYNSHEQFEDLKIIFDGITANGGNSLGLRDTTDARANLVGDNQVKENLIFCENSDDVIDVSPVFKQNLKGRAEKLIPRKRARTEACYNSEELKNDNNDSMIIVSKKILSIIQQKRRETAKRG